MTSIKTVLSPTDFSQTAERANRRAVKIAKREGAELVFVHILENAAHSTHQVMKHKSFPNLADEVRKGAEREIEELRAKLAGDEVQASAVIRTGVPSIEITECAKEVGADLIVIGTHGYGAIRKFLLGSTAERLMRIAPCSVLLVRDEDDAAD